MSTFKLKVHQNLTQILRPTNFNSRIKILFEVIEQYFYLIAITMLCSKVKLNKCCLKIIFFLQKKSFVIAYDCLYRLKVQIIE